MKMKYGHEEEYLENIIKEYLGSDATLNDIVDVEKANGYGRILYSRGIENKDLASTGMDVKTAELYTIDTLIQKGFFENIDPSTDLYEYI